MSVKVVVICRNLGDCIGDCIIVDCCVVVD